jgi:hypothetical protein
MNLSARTTMAGATALLALLLTTAACGSDSVVSDPGPSVGHAATGGDRQRHGGVSADAAERQAGAEKARQDRASSDRWDRSTQVVPSSHAHR